ncbi:MAG: NADH-quinone oxidoreductase subunit H [Chloroflexi bacterium]|nr:NADH-quinone oxidoreductase subunit H [Chloroflexota bacterium]
MDVLRQLLIIAIFPGGIFMLLIGLVYAWINGKLIARLQNRVGPRWFQPFADMLKLITKEEIVPEGTNKLLFELLPIVALAGPMTAALYVPMAGLRPSSSFQGDLIVTIYLLSLMTLCTGFAGANTRDRFSTIGATRALTQLFSYEAPFLLALLGPAIVAGTWQISEIITTNQGLWLVVTQPISFVIAIIGLMGKLEMHPFDAPEAKTEIVAGALTEYSGRGLALFKVGHYVELVIGLTLVAALFLGGLANPLMFLLKTLGLLLGISFLEALMTRLRIDQTVGLWWRYGSVLALLQLVILVIWSTLVS